MKRALVSLMLLPANLLMAQSEPAAEIKRVAGMQKAWDRFEIKNPNHLQITFQPNGEITKDGHRFRKFRAFAKGAPTGTKFTFLVYQVNGNVQPMNEAWVNDAGLIMCKQPSPEQKNVTEAGDDEIDLISGGAEGEPQRYALLSEDQSR